MEMRTGMATMTMLEAAMRGDLIAFTNLFLVHLCYLPDFFFCFSFTVALRRN